MDQSILLNNYKHLLVRVSPITRMHGGLFFSYEKMRDLRTAQTRSLSLSTMCGAESPIEKKLNEALASYCQILDVAERNRRSQQGPCCSKTFRSCGRLA